MYIYLYIYISIVQCTCFCSCYLCAKYVEEQCARRPFEGIEPVYCARNGEEVRVNRST